MSFISDEDWEQFRNASATIPETDAVAMASIEQAQASAATEWTRSALIENAPYAVAQIAHLARYAKNERIKLDASKYIVERVLGPAGGKMEGTKSPLESLVGKLVEDAEEFANAATNGSGDGSNGLRGGE